MLIDDVLKCSFSSWYSIFAPLTIKSDIFKIDNRFKEYLLSDGIILPQSCQDEMNGDGEQQNGGENNGYLENGLNDLNINHNGHSEIKESDDDISDSEDNNTLDTKPPEFPELEGKIKDCLQINGSIFPKLNWSSCEDSRWIQASGTKCSSISEVFLLLKSSDKIVHDLTDPFEHCTDIEQNQNHNVEYELILRKWININPSMEFRCFIYNNQIIGISQRDVRSYYDYMKKDEDKIISDILEFFRNNIANKFLLDHFVIDVYRPKTGSIILVDINPFGELTDSLLFDWNDLRSKANAPPPPQFKDFRFIEDRFGIQTQRFEMNSLPVDVFNGNVFMER